jgi:hypothetical protein
LPQLLINSFCITEKRGRASFFQPHLKTAGTRIHTIRTSAPHAQDVTHATYYFSVVYMTYVVFPFFHHQTLNTESFCLSFLFGGPMYRQFAVCHKTGNA